MFTSRSWRQWLLATLLALPAGIALAQAPTSAELTDLGKQVATLTATVKELLSLTGRPAVAPPVGQNFFFARDLKFGDRGADVLALQRWLNQNPETQLAGQGICSPGQETEEFNLLTKLAVIKFQEKYAAEILRPLGLTAGTGFVGPLTRAKLNSLLAIRPLGALAGQAGQATGAIGLPSGLPGGLPAGFSTTDALTQFLMSLSVKPAAGSLPTNLPAVLPPTLPATALPTTTYQTLTNLVAPGLPLPPVAAVRLTAITPPAIEIGQTLTIRGEGFTPTGNTIQTSFGIFSDEPSVDGQTLVFQFTSAVLQAMVGATEDETTVIPPQPVAVIVSNARGASNPLSFQVIFK